MPKFDMTITVTVVIAICAIISPVITTLLNNHHLYKMKKLDMELELEEKTYYYKRGIYEEYLKAAGRCCKDSTYVNLSAYGESYLLARIYSPKEIEYEMYCIDDFISKKQYEQAMTCLSSLAPKIHTILENM